ncbi:MAG: Type 1 glutamine amidotransferase-like domain-containing protein, partial [Candidatus Shapirobacteria bacterium]|nr:Type 1 glutamine amidotransferase-like domain-containing protein [Candidatus Shapirobacteria bacterium]
MKLLLTSGGLENKSIIKALSDLLQKPFEESKVVFISSAANIEEDKSYVEKDYLSLTKIGVKEIQKFDILNKSLSKIKK